MAIYITQSSFFVPVNKNGEEVFDLVLTLNKRKQIISLSKHELEELKNEIEKFLRIKNGDN